MICVYFRSIDGTILSTKINNNPTTENDQEIILWQRGQFSIKLITSIKQRLFKIKDSTYYVNVFCDVFEDKYQQSSPITNLPDILSNLINSISQENEKIYLFNKDKFNGLYCNNYIKDVYERLSSALNIIFVE